jgi:Transposase DDE domain
MDSQSVKTTERGGVRGFDAHKRVKGRKRHTLVDTSGLLIARRVAPADISDRTSTSQLLGGLGPLFPHIRTVIADAGHESRKLSRHLMQQDVNFYMKDRQNDNTEASTRMTVRH